MDLEASAPSAPRQRRRKHCVPPGGGYTDEPLTNIRKDIGQGHDASLSSLAQLTNTLFV